MYPKSSSHMSVTSHFHSLLRNKRNEIKKLSSHISVLKETLSRLEEENGMIKDKPFLFRKRRTVQKNIELLKECIEKLETGDHEKEFEEKVAPFSREFIRRREEEETKNPGKTIGMMVTTEDTDHIQLTITNTIICPSVIINSRII